MTSYRVFIGAFLAITCFNLVLFLQQRQNRVQIGENGSTKSSIWIDPTYKLLRQLDDDRLFIIEPYMLALVLGIQKLKDLKWRFDLPEFQRDSGSVTLATFGNQMFSLANRPDLTEVAQVQGPLPFSNRTVVQHLFYKHNDLRVHIVVLHPVKHFLWIGQIPEQQFAALKGFNVHFGKHEEIYDRFKLVRVDSVQFPNEIGHFLSQMPTSRYMHCAPEKQNWLQKNNVKFDQNRVEITVESIISIKALMKELQMEFWAMCGTLLGWYRQCGPIPYTTDNDFSTWPKYMNGKDISPLLLKTALKHNLKLLYRFGEPWHSMEYSFKTKDNRDKVDMFVTYRNSSHFLMPFHITWKHEYQYSIYPQYQLCSIELLGFKLLAPCQAEAVVLAEYGPRWDKPKEEYDYAESPFNTGPKLPFPKNISQFSQY